jgi:5-formyltetrahydrofolate cyclo-ligase
MNLQAMKQALRQSIIARREAVPRADHDRMSSEISRHIIELEEYKKANTVLGFLSFGTEYESRGWVTQVLTDDKRLLLPRVNKATRELDIFRVCDPATQLEVGSYGIREPIPERCDTVALEEIDFILLPGVGFERDGSRLGYGGGFYDKFLARLPHRPVLVAAAFSLQLTEGIPQEPTDRKVDRLVTELEVIDCTAERAAA